MKPCKVEIVDRPFNRETGFQFRMTINGRDVDWPIESYHLVRKPNSAPRLILVMHVDELYFEGEGIELEPYKSVLNTSPLEEGE